MTTYLLVIGLAIFLVALAFAGLAVKSFFRKDAKLTTCSGGTGNCGCQSAESCNTETESKHNHLRNMDVLNKNDLKKIHY